MTASTPVDQLPGWWQPLLSRVAAASREDFSRLATPTDQGRASAVLILLAESAPDLPDVLLLQRAAQMRTHGGQPAFPGGAADAGDADPSATALREAAEEVGLDPSSVRVLALLPPLWIPVSGFVVDPVLAWWRHPHPVGAVDSAEVQRVVRVPIAELTDPGNRIRVRHPSGYVGPAFRVRDMLVWGFTAGILSALLQMAGWSRPWDELRAPVALPDARNRPVP